MNEMDPSSPSFYSSMLIGRAVRIARPGASPFTGRVIAAAKQTDGVIWTVRDAEGQERDLSRTDLENGMRDALKQQATLQRSGLQASGVRLQGIQGSGKSKRSRIDCDDPGNPQIRQEGTSSSVHVTKKAKLAAKPPIIPIKKKKKSATTQGSVITETRHPSVSSQGSPKNISQKGPKPSQPPCRQYTDVRPPPKNSESSSLPIHQKRTKATSMPKKQGRVSSTNIPKGISVSNLTAVSSSSHSAKGPAAVLARIRAFRKTHGRWPRQNRKDTDENKLAINLSSYKRKRPVSVTEEEYAVVQEWAASTKFPRSMSSSLSSAPEPSIVQGESFPVTVGEFHGTIPWEMAKGMASFSTSLSSAVDYEVKETYAAVIPKEKTSKIERDDCVLIGEGQAFPSKVLAALAYDREAHKVNSKNKSQNKVTPLLPLNFGDLGICRRCNAFTVPGPPNSLTTALQMEISALSTSLSLSITKSLPSEFGLSSTAGNQCVFLPDKVLLCDECDGEVHLKCAGLYAVPEGSWFCSETCKAQYHSKENKTDFTSNSLQASSTPPIETSLVPAITSDSTSEPKRPSNSETEAKELTARLLQRAASLSRSHETQRKPTGALPPPDAKWVGTRPVPTRADWIQEDQLPRADRRYDEPKGQCANRNVTKSKIEIEEKQPPCQKVKSAFELFAESERPLPGEAAHWSVVNIARLLSLRWKQLGHEGRCVWERRAEEQHSSSQRADC